MSDAISHSSQCSTTGVTKGCGMCYPVLWDDAYKRTLAAKWDSTFTCPNTYLLIKNKIGRQADNHTEGF